MKLTEQYKGTLLAFIAIMFITPDSLFIRLANLESWNLIFLQRLYSIFGSFCWYTNSL